MRIHQCIAITCLAVVGAAVALPARAAVRDAKIDKLVARGLDWVASTQSRLGHWSANDSRYPTAMTALAGVALLSEGSTTTQGKYSKNIRMAVDYLLSRSRSNGLIGDPGATTAIPMATAIRCCFCLRCWARRKMKAAARN